MSQGFGSDSSLGRSATFSLDGGNCSGVSASTASALAASGALSDTHSNRKARGKMYWPLSVNINITFLRPH
jgi:hypothetical protein